MPDSVKVFFTYGSGGQPFRGGWTEITAPSFHIACQVFKAIHPCKYADILNCCDAYTEERFMKTGMYSEGNLGAFCHERITVSITTPSGKEHEK